MSPPLILCYHAVSPRWGAPLSTTPENLDRQLTCLVRRGFRGLTFTEAALNPGLRRAMAVTFDDAFLSVFELARPILGSLGLPGTVFAPTAFMGSRQPLVWPGIEKWGATPHAGELLGMDWNDLSTLAAEGWEIGSHTHTHPHLSRITDAELAGELERSRAEVSDRFGSCESIAYPYGDVDERVAVAAEHAGYRAGAELSTHLRPRGPLRQPRVGIYHVDVAWRYELKVNPMMRRLRATSLWPRPAPTGPPP